VHDDAVTADLLVETVVVNRVLASAVFPPDLEAEGVHSFGTGAIAGPQHELVGVAVRVRCSVDRPAALELGVRPTLVDHQPLVARGVEVEAAGLELELGVAAVYGQSQL